MYLVKYFSTNNQCYKNNVNKSDSRYTTFQNRGPQGLMLHSVGCAQPNAEVFAKQWNRSGIEVAVHAVVQADGTVYQCLPWNYRGWHCAGNANNTHIGVEMTEPSQIKYTGGSSFSVSDKAAAQAQARGTYQTAVQLFAQLCKQYGLNPLKDGVIVSHHEGYLRGVASNHGDPEHLWRGLGLSYTMDGFRKDVKAAMNGTYVTTQYEVGWHQDSTGWWYADTATSYYKSRWAKIDGEWYFFNDGGYMMANTWVVDSTGTYYVGANGAMVKNMDVEIGADGKLVPVAKKKHYNKISEVSKTYRPDLDVLVKNGMLKGRSGSGDDLVLDMDDDSVRIAVIMSRALQKAGIVS